MQLRDYQIKIAEQGFQILNTYKILCLSMEVRTGKTLTALQVSRLYGAKHPLFLTKKKAIASIQSDFDSLYENTMTESKITIINYEQLHNFSEENFDLIICDESHCLGQFPTPAVRTKLLKNIARGLPIIFLSGTFTPESYSQIFHQLWISSFSPFNEFTSFYKWAAVYVNKKVKYVYNRQLNDYSDARRDLIMPVIEHLFISYTQSEAGFEQMVKEEVLRVQMKDSTYALVKKLINDRVHIGRNGCEILADTEVKLQQKLHQVYSGTVLAEDGTPVCFDNSKCDFIREFFAGKKIAIFYKFKAELIMLEKTFAGRTTFSPEHFNESSELVFVSQIQSGREGINLSTADCLVMFNIDFSSVSYQQVKARMQSKDRTKEALLYWVFANNGIEEMVYERVMDKKDYTLSYFRKDFKIKKKELV